MSVEWQDDIKVVTSDLPREQVATTHNPLIGTMENEDSQKS